MHEYHFTDIPDDVFLALSARAFLSNRSIEDEAIAIIMAALSLAPTSTSEDDGSGASKDVTAGPPASIAEG